MSDQCCGSNHEPNKTKSSCCSSNPVNEEVAAALEKTTSCCSSKTKKQEQPGPSVVNDCCSSTVQKEGIDKVNTSSCCSSQQPTEAVAQVKAASCYSSPQNESDATSPAVGEKLSYRVYGMDCPSCAKTLEKGIGSLKDIQEVKVMYSTSKMEVVADNPSAFAPIENEVRKLGFTAEPMNERKNLKTYTVEGMDCGSCAKSIQNHLNKVSGVQSVNVNFSTGKMKIEHTNSADEIMKEVTKIGFSASLDSNRSIGQSAPKNNEKGLLILSGVLIAFGFAGSYADVSPLMSNILYAIAMMISGYKPVKSAFYSIKSRSLDMNVLMSAAAFGAAFIGQWLEGATVVWLFALGNLLQNRSIEQTRNSIRNLMDLAPPEAWVQAGTELVKKPVEDISIGDVIIVKPGDKIPLDGEVIKGESSVNQAPITGESIPVDKEAGNTVYAGTINEHGTLEIRVTKLVEDTTIAKIIHLVEEAQEQKAPTQAFVDKFANIYTPIVFVIALLIMVLPPLMTLGSWGEWFYKGLELLVIACPCALVISTPVAIVSAIGNAAKNGILIKGGTFLEKAGAITAIAFDKTGTLTEGKPKVSNVEVLNGSKEDLLSIAFTLENFSTHPIAKAIVEYAKTERVSSKDGELYKSIVGKGVQARIDGITYYAGNLSLFNDISDSLDDRCNQRVSELQNQGKTVVIIGTTENVLGIISVSDTIRESTTSSLKSLHASGIRETVMLTGDNEGTANLIAFEANVSRYYAELLPEDKVSAIKKLQSEGYTVAMVGDGINDAPALAVADLGIAMGGAGTDTAMETADIVLMADNLDKLPHTMKLSQKALAIIKQNIWFSIIVKLIALGLIFPGWLTLWMAVLSDTGAALIVILNALRLLKEK
ncbi:heavy metal translocating P-type ATPase [Fictibacillus sp. S7]|uniref:heavy metal translocating P-type ATPase n=1 Tax=Fictibacillus sp. S7 TaxID=2212476 RepID=UPI001012A740|nr:heavy metal translocating P-type ATPase [Fictibacillus sp. S7]RXZ02178.1 cadmium-translocating P-type ATPase [Fictibacillus sp. S7]